jgi:hypothetical protein
MNNEESSVGFNPKALARLQDAKKRLADETEINRTAMERRVAANKMLSIKRDELKASETQVAATNYRELAKTAIREELRQAQLPFKQYARPVGPLTEEQAKTD